MSDAVINKLSTVDLATLVAIIILVSIVIKFISPLFSKLKSHIIDKYKKEKKDENLEDIVRSTQARMKQYEDNRIHDREQSFKIQKELTDAISELSKRLEDMQREQEARYQESISRENKRIRAELKDRISQSYRYHNEKQEWNAMEKEALEDLIQEYEDAGGENSFVHSKVQKDMYTWKLIDCGYIPHSNIII